MIIIHTIIYVYTYNDHTDSSNTNDTTTTTTTNNNNNNKHNDDNNTDNNKCQIASSLGTLAACTTTTTTTTTTTHDTDTDTDNYTNPPGSEGPDSGQAAAEYLSSSSSL